MQKFTVFTVVLSIVVVVIVADLVVNNYLPGLENKNVLSDVASEEFDLPSGIDISKALETNVLGADDVGEFQTNHLGFDVESSTLVARDVSTEEKSIPPDMEVETETDVTDTAGLGVGTEVDTETATVDVGTNSEDASAGLGTETGAVTSSDFEDSDFAVSSKNVFLRDEQIKSAGFVSAYIEEEEYDGQFYKTIYTEDLFDVSVKKMVIKSKDAMFAKVYAMKIGPSSSLDEVYNVLKVRGAEGLDTEINETNEFADGSFYMNDTGRPKTAFLTVKIGNLIYGFSYPKEYHPQVTNLIKLLVWEK